MAREQAESALIEHEAIIREVHEESTLLPLITHKEKQKGGQRADDVF